MAKHSITINNKKMAYLDEGQGPVLLLGHSFLWDSEMWRPQIDALSTSFRCIAPDLWGHGDSAPLGETQYDLRQLSQDYIALLDALSIETCTVIGLSVGGMWGTELALNTPERVNGLVIMDTYVGPEPETTKQQYYELIDAIVNANQFPEPIISTIAPLFFAKQTAVEGNALFEGLKTHFREFNPDNISSISVLSRTIFDRADLRQRLPELSALPCLVMVGEEDMPRPPKEAQEMAKLMSCDCIELPNAGHIANLEQPALTTDALQKFLVQALAAA